MKKIVPLHENSCHLHSDDLSGWLNFFNNNRRSVADIDWFDIARMDKKLFNTLENYLKSFTSFDKLYECFFHLSGYVLIKKDNVMYTYDILCKEIFHEFKTEENSTIECFPGFIVNQNHDCEEGYDDDFGLDDSEISQYQFLKINGEELISGERFVCFQLATNRIVVVEDQNGLYYYLTSEGEELFPGKRWKRIFCDVNGLATVKDENGWFYYKIDEQKELFPGGRRWKYITSFNGDKAIVFDSDFYYLTKAGERIVVSK